LWIPVVKLVLLAYLLLLGGCDQVFRLDQVTPRDALDEVDSDADSDLDASIDAPVDTPDAWTDCFCSGAALMCPQANETCAATCLATPDPHCSQLIPSNTIDRALVAQVSTKITVSAATAIDAGTGAITGGVTRASGTGLKSGIYYAQVGNLGVFVFDELEVTTGITLRVFGSRPAVFLVAKTVRVTGIIDVSGDQGTISEPGAGGGKGGVGAAVAAGCGPGGAGTKSGTEFSDSGGGGGGGGALGGRGGKADAENGGTGGAACIPLTLEPLVGGSGGGVGAQGTANEAEGGGGGGALQISSLEQIIIAGTIDVGGSGGQGGRGDTSGTVKNAGGGGGGGSGGALLLEAPVVTVNTGAVLAANGGAGGGAGDSDLNGTTGADGNRSSAVATGGAPAGTATKGGNGGAGTTPAQQGTDTTNNTTNTGGGGGGVGRIFIRAHTTPTLSGTVSPPATTGAFRAD
jgi:hypothetical protein